MPLPPLEVLAFSHQPERTGELVFGFVEAQKLGDFARPGRPFADVAELLASRGRPGNHLLQHYDLRVKAGDLPETVHDLVQVSDVGRGEAV